MNNYFTFDDVLIRPNFSTILSRKDVDISTKLGPFDLKLPILAANMDTICGESMAAAMSKAGGLGVLHRFWSIEEESKVLVNLLDQQHNVACSVGIGEYELERAKKMIALGCKVIAIDVAHGAQLQVVEQFKKIKYFNPDVFLIVGNFATADSILEFVAKCGYAFVKDFNEEAIIKVGIGPGSVCLTRLKTGVGVPQLSAIIDCVSTGVSIIADGGMRSPGDIAKSLAVGANCVMLGGMLAGTEETPGETVYKGFRDPFIGNTGFIPAHKAFRGSASKESYKIQNKEATWRAVEGESVVVPYKGTVVNILQDIEGGLRSSLTYVGANNLKDFKEKAKLIKITTNTVVENTAHGKNITIS